MGRAYCSCSVCGIVLCDHDDEYTVCDCNSVFCERCKANIYKEYESDSWGGWKSCPECDKYNIKDHEVLAWALEKLDINIDIAILEIMKEKHPLYFAKVMKEKEDKYNQGDDKIED